MRYEILGNSLPVVVCHLNPGEAVITESGSMSWMSPNMQMETNSGGEHEESIWQIVIRRQHFSEPLYSTGEKD